MKAQVEMQVFTLIVAVIGMIALGHMLYQSYNAKFNSELEFAIKTGDIEGEYVLQNLLRSTVRINQHEMTVAEAISIQDYQDVVAEVQAGVKKIMGVCFKQWEFTVNDGSFPIDTLKSGTFDLFQNQRTGVSHGCKKSKITTIPIPRVGKTVPYSVTLKLCGGATSCQ